MKRLKHFSRKASTQTGFLQRQGLCNMVTASCCKPRNLPMPCPASNSHQHWSLPTQPILPRLCPWMYTNRKMVDRLQLSFFTREQQTRLMTNLMRSLGLLSQMNKKKQGCKKKKSSRKQSLQHHFPGFLCLFPISISLVFREFLIGKNCF